MITLEGAIAESSVVFDKSKQHVDEFNEEYVEKLDAYDTIMLKVARGLLQGINLVDQKQDYLENLAKGFVDLATSSLTNITATFMRDDSYFL